MGSRGPLALFASLAAATPVCTAQTARADEGGVPFWFLGQYASFAAIPMTPGWSMPIQGYYYGGGASGDTDLPRGNVATAGLDTTLSLVLAQPTWAHGKKIMGGQLALGLGFGWGPTAPTPIWR